MNACANNTQRAKCLFEVRHFAKRISLPPPERSQLQTARKGAVLDTSLS